MNLFDEENLIEITKNRLYFINSNLPPKLSKNEFYFSTDKQFKYQPFFSDYGPLNISNVVTYIKEMTKLLSKSEKQSLVIFHYTDMFSSHRLNAAFLMGCFMVISKDF
jgi:cell division cycle 14